MSLTSALNRSRCFTRLLNAPIAVGNVTVTMLRLFNVAWELNRELQLNTTGGRIEGDPEAMKMWGRAYEKGWAPEV